MSKKFKKDQTVLVVIPFYSKNAKVVKTGKHFTIVEVLDELGGQMKVSNENLLKVTV